MRGSKLQNGFVCNIPDHSVVYFSVYLLKCWDSTWSQYLCGFERISVESLFSLSTLQILGPEFKSSDLRATSLIH